MQSISNEAESTDWKQLAPMLDDALAELRQKDHDALVLRYFQNKSLADVGTAIGTNEDTARMRINRALEKLRKFFVKKGVVLTATAITAAISANSVQAAPAGLAIKMSAVLGKGLATTTTITTLVNTTMKTMTWLKMTLAIAAAAAALLLGGVATVAVSKTQSGGQLTPVEVHKKAMDAYASLSSYSDEGTYSFASDPIKVTATFNIKLARPNLYRIQYARSNTFSSSDTVLTNQGVVWSAGNGDFQVREDGVVRHYQSGEQSLVAAIGVSGGVTGTIPGNIFIFKRWLNPLDILTSGAKQEPDEKIGGVDCYVFSTSGQISKETLWIGKKDFLVRQVRHMSIPEVAQPALGQSKKSTGVTSPTVSPGLIDVETHSNIVVNETFPLSDFQQTP